MVSMTWEMGCNVVEPGYVRPRQGVLETDDILAEDRRKVGALGEPGSGHGQMQRTLLLLYA